MTEESGIFKEYIKPIITTTLSGLFFVIWWSWTQGIEADKEAKANLFGKWDAQQQRNYEACKEDNVILEGRVYELTLKLIENNVCK